MGADSTGVTEANPLWRFSLVLYGQDGVADACIALQDSAGLDVNLLLYCSFASACGVALTPLDIATVDAAVSDWRTRVVLPLRARRRDATGKQRETLLQEELQAEQRQQALMWESRSPPGNWPPIAGAAALLGANLAALAVANDLDGQRLSLFETLVGGLLPGLAAHL